MALYHMAKGPVNYTVVGNPAITNGIVSGLSDSNYLQIPELPGAQDYFDAVNPFEMVLRITTGTITRQQYVYYGDFALSITASKNLQLYYYDGEGIFVGGTATLQDNTSYDIKLTYDGANIIVSYKTGNNAYTQDIVATGQITKIADNEFFGNRPPFNDVYLQGSIDLNNTYISVNGQPWFGDCPIEVKRHQIMGPVGYTVVGSPTIVDGVVSGFSQNDYPLINSSINIKNITETMFKLYIDTSTIVEDFLNFFLLQDGIRAQYYFNKNLDYGVNMKIYVAGAGHTSTSRNIPTDTWFYLKTTYDGTTYKAFKSLDKNTWEQLMSFDVDLSSEEDTTSFRIGSNPTQSANYFRGSIDLNETYIKENNELWFYQPAPTKYIIHEDKNTREQKLVFADQSMYLTGPVNYTVVGTPTIVDNVASNFSDNNYLQAGSHIIFNNNSNVEFNVRFKTPSDLSNTTAQYLVCFSNSNGHYGVTYGNDGVFEIRLPQRSGGAYGYGISYQPNTWYSIKSVIQNNGCETFLYNNTGTQIGHIPFSQFLGSFSLDSVLNIGKDSILSFELSGVQGSVDLNDTYIKVNDQLWFYGKNYSSKNIAPVPSGFTYSNATTPYIGYVDMPTQTYHQAPAGTKLVTPDGREIYDDYVIEDNKLVAVNPNIYLEGTGTQYINTGVYAKYGYTTNATFMVLKKGQDTTNLLMYGQGIAPGYGFQAYEYTQNSEIWLYTETPADGAVSSYATYYINTKYNLKTTIENDVLSFYINGVLDITKNLTSTSAVATGPTIIFKNGAKARSYGSLQIFDDNKQLVRNFVPVPAGLVIGNFTVPSNGMFDIVNQQFYSNQGTGEFTIGRDE